MKALRPFRILAVSSDEFRRDIVELILTQLEEKVEITWVSNQLEARFLLLESKSRFDLVVGVEDEGNGIPEY